jgi:hypothetical protein
MKHVKYLITANLNKNKNKDSASVFATFTQDQKYKSNGIIDILHNPDSSTPHFVIVNIRSRKNDDSELIIHAVGSDVNKYTINSMNVNGH